MKWWRKFVEASLNPEVYNAPRPADTSWDELRARMTKKREPDPADRTLGDVLRWTACTCRRFAFRHKPDCPILSPTAQPEWPEEGEREPDPDPVPLGRLPQEEELEILDADGHVAEVIPIRPKLARDYVGVDWPTQNIPVIKLCAACQKNMVPPDEDYCERCDEFTHVRTLDGEVVASYDDFGNRVNLT